MAIIERQGKYQIKVRDNIGHWFPSKTFIRKVDAERYERNLLSMKDKGRGMMNYRTYSRRLKEMCKILNLPIVNTHGLRHSTAEIYLNEGASLEDIRRLLNQSCSSITQRYIHRTEDRLTQIASTIDFPKDIEKNAENLNVSVLNVPQNPKSTALM